MKMLKASNRCLIFGVLGLLPVIGLPFAVAALWLAGGIRRQEKRYWNPAKPYRMFGVTCAAAGTIGWFLVATGILAHSIANG